MIRTAAAFGWGYAYMGGSADPWGPKTIRAGAGGQFQTSVARIGSLAELSEWTTVASVVREGGPLSDITSRPVALLIGEEAQGLPPQVIGSADHRITISTTGPTESLNAAVAAGIAVYELSRLSGEGEANV
jgi:RNA methyltransferase, TrmH family